MVYNAIKKAKKPRSAGVPGDLPKKLVQEFPVELATPVAKVFRSIMKSNKWPSKWACPEESESASHRVRPKNN